MPDERLVLEESRKDSIHTHRHSFFSTDLTQHTVTTVQSLPRFSATPQAAPVPTHLLHFSLKVVTRGCRRNVRKLAHPPSCTCTRRGEGRAERPFSRIQLPVGDFTLTWKSNTATELKASVSVYRLECCFPNDRLARPSRDNSWSVLL